MRTLLEKYRACKLARDWTGKKSIEDAWNMCERADWLLWLAAKMIDRKIVVRAACAVARTSLKYVDDGETRPLFAIEIAERWCDRKATIAYAAYAANAADAAANAAANAAAYAAYAAAADAAANAAAYAAYAAAYAQKNNENIVRRYITAEMIRGASYGARRYSWCIALKRKIKEVK